MSNIQEKGIHLLYKKLGETPYQCVTRFKTENPDFASISMTYAGRLDPMAEGLLLVLSGEEIVKKDEYTGLSKQYEFDVLWGVETDTQDILGEVGEGPDRKTLNVLYSECERCTAPVRRGISIAPTVDKVISVLQNSIGRFDQKYPAYSSQTVGGKSLIEWSRLGRISEVEIPTHSVELKTATHIARKFISGTDLLSEIVRRVSLVTGDFRQEQIVEKWRKILMPLSEKMFTLDIVKVDVSGGFYIRQLVADMARELGTSATTFHILRRKVGDYTL